MIPPKPNITNTYRFIRFQLADGSYIEFSESDLKALSNLKNVPDLISEWFDENVTYDVAIVGQPLKVKP